VEAVPSSRFRQAFSPAFEELGAQIEREWIIQTFNSLFFLAASRVSVVLCSRRPATKLPGSGGTAAARAAADQARAAALPAKHWPPGPFQNDRQLSIRRPLQLKERSSNQQSSKHTRQAANQQGLAVCAYASDYEAPERGRKRQQVRWMDVGKLRSSPLCGGPPPAQPAHPHAPSAGPDCASMLA
jgi:hypothetical protein